MVKDQASLEEGTDESDAYPDRQPETKVLEEPGNSAKQTKQKGQPKKRDTHFLCFPLVSDTSIPQLAKSLQYFREVTTKPSHREKDRSSGHQNIEAVAPESNNTAPSESSRTERDTGLIEPNTNRDHKLEPFNADLQILPAIAHRPPGTFHLTLGVMDLSQKEEMERALRLLQDLDYTAILHEVLAQPEELKHTRERSRDDESLRQTNPSSDPENQDESTVTSLERPVSLPKMGSSSKNTTEFSKNSPPLISLTGLSTFPSAKTSRVFYAKPSPTITSPFPLLQFGQAIRRKFREAQFITETRPLVLHATVANMRYAVQARGGRTSKGRSWRYGKDRWKEGQVDARELIKCFDNSEGDVEEYTKGKISSDQSAREFIWAKDIAIDRVAICKMGAEKSDDEILGATYPPVGEKMIFV